MRNIIVNEIPFDLGQPRSGVRKAYAVLKAAGLVGRLGEIKPVLEALVPVAPKAPDTNLGIREARQAALASQEISSHVVRNYRGDAFQLNVGGDHGMALGTIHGFLHHRPDAVVIWVDAHGDLNTPETSPSGNFHGMPLAFLLNIARHPQFSWLRNFVNPNRLILIGPRDLDPGEVSAIRNYGIQYFSSEDLGRLGAPELLAMALHRADPDGTAPIHLSFDVDVFDGADLASTGTRVDNGPGIEELFLLGGLIAETGRLCSMDLVEFNPELGTTEEVRAATDLILDFTKTVVRHAVLGHHGADEKSPLDRTLHRKHTPP
jgi:arginase